MINYYKIKNDVIGTHRILNHCRKSFKIYFTVVLAVMVPIRKNFMPHHFILCPNFDQFNKVYGQ